MKNAYLVSLSEISPKDLVEASGRVKALITDPTILINPKGLDIFPITSYHRFIVFTNHEEAIKPTGDSRRHFVVRCSDELCKKDTFNTPKTGAELQKINDYFRDFRRRVIDNENAIKSIYEWLKSIDVSGFKDIMPPQTEFHLSQSQLTTSPIESFLKHLTLQNHHLNEFKIASGDLFAQFSQWNAKNNRGYDCTSGSFHAKLRNMKVDGITNGGHMRNGEAKIINIPMLKTRFGITEVIEDNEMDEEPSGI
jgi:phage/plasmid-associated DNA primase